MRRELHEPEIICRPDRVDLGPRRPTSGGGRGVAATAALSVDAVDAAFADESLSALEVAGATQHRADAAAGNEAETPSRRGIFASLSRQLAQIESQQTQIRRMIARAERETRLDV